MLQNIEDGLARIDEQIGLCNFRGGLATAMSLAQETNKFLDDTAPWKALPDDRPGAARSLYTVLCAINGLKIAFYPYLPHSTEQLHAYLGFEAPVADDGWALVRPAPNQQLSEPKPLFVKLEPEIANEEEERLAS